MERDILPSSLDSFQNVCKNIERWTLTLYFSNLISFSLQFFGCFLFHFFLSHSIFINSSLLTLATTFQAPPFIYLFFWCWKIQVLTLHNYLRLLFFFFLANFLIRFFPFSIPSSSYSSWVACFLSAPQILFKSLSLSLSSSISLPLSHILINPSCYLSCPPNPHDYEWSKEKKRTLITPTTMILYQTLISASIHQLARFSFPKHHMFFFPYIALQNVKYCSSSTTTQEIRTISCNMA